MSAPRRRWQTEILIARINQHQRITKTPGGSRSRRDLHLARRYTRLCVNSFHPPSYNFQRSVIARTCVVAIGPIDSDPVSRVNYCLLKRDKSAQIGECINSAIKSREFTSGIHPLACSLFAFFFFFYYYCSFNYR